MRAGPDRRLEFDRSRTGNDALRWLAVVGPDVTVSLHAGASDASLPLLAVVSVAAVGAAALFGLAVGAFVRRRSRSYLLVVGGFGALLSRSGAVAFTAAGAISPSTHHLLEHALDVVFVALVVAAVYHARTPPPEVDRP